jgi:hypothetical protein
MFVLIGRGMYGFSIEYSETGVFSMFCQVVWKEYCKALPRLDLVLTVHCNLINFAFQIFPLFIPEMPAGFTSYIVQIIPIYFDWIL